MPYETRTHPERAGAARADPSSRLDPSSRTLRSRDPTTASPSPSRLDQPTCDTHNRRNCSVNRNRHCLKVVDRFRKGEILTLRWSDYREGHLFLRDSKTGPRTVWALRGSTGRPRPSATLRVFCLPGGRSARAKDVAAALLVAGEGGSGSGRCPPARSETLIREHGASQRRVGPHARPPARSREAGHHPEIRTSLRHIGSRGGRFPRPDPLRGEDVNRRKGMRLTDAGIAGLKPGQDGIHRLGWPGCRARRSRASIGTSQLRLARACQRRGGQVDHRLCRAHDRRRRPARMPGASER